MFESSQYELLDFGQGRKLERFGPHVLDRPCPAAADIAWADPAAWKQADARYQREGEGRGQWLPASFLGHRWTVHHKPLQLELKATEFGHVGLFPEQAQNWQWLARQLHQAGAAPRALNLFAHTGGSTLAAAAAGGEVVHVDSARNVVQWARRNAELSGLGRAPIRWIVEDAAKFVRREVRRGCRYDAVILDPPSYGHGPQGQVWKLTQHLLPLLRGCAQLTQPQPTLLLVTCHTPAFGRAELSAAVADAFFGHCGAGPAVRALALVTPDGRRLPCGLAARWPDRRE